MNLEQFIRQDDFWKRKEGEKMERTSTGQEDLERGGNNFMTSDTETVRAYVVSRIEVDTDTEKYNVVMGVVRSYLGVELAQLKSPEPIEIIEFKASKKECPFRSKDQLVWALKYILKNAIFYDGQKPYIEARYRLYEFARDADLDADDMVIGLDRYQDKPLVSLVNPIRYDPQFHPPLYP